MKKWFFVCLLLCVVALWAEYPAGYFYTIFRGDTFCVYPVITDSVMEAEWFDYTSASMHTGHETAYESHYFFFYNPMTGNIGLVVQHNIDEVGTADATCILYLDDLPTGCALAMSDDASEFDLSAYPQGNWHWWDNTDGGAFYIPRDEWQFTVRPTYGSTDPIRSFWFISGDEGEDRIYLDTVYIDQEDTIIVGHGFLQLLTDEEFIDFDSVNVGSTDTLYYKVCNSDETMDILLIGEVELPDPSLFTILYAPMEMAPGECDSFIILFHPADTGSFIETMVLHMNTPCDSIKIIPVLGRSIQPRVDSIWFFEETDCDGQNIVEICYSFYGDPESELPVAVELTTDTSVGAWFDFADYTIEDADGDIAMVHPGLHCFTWILSDDFPNTELSEFAVRAIVTLGSAETGEWRMFQYDAQNTGRTPYACCSDWSSMDTLWTYDAGAPVSKAAVYRGENIYFVSTDGTVHAVRFDGTPLWTTSFGTSVSGGPALLEDGTIIIGTNDDEVFAINEAGGIEWTYSSSLGAHGIKGYPTIADDGTIYITSYYDSWNGILISLQPDGTLNWEISIPGGGTWTQCTPAVDGDRIFTTDFNNSPGKLSCFNSSGSIIWQWTDYPSGGETDLLSSPTLDIARDLIYFGSNKTDPRGIVAVDDDAITPTLAWFYDAGAGNNVNNSVALDSDGNIYVGAIDGTFYSLDTDGILRWSQSMGWMSDAIIDALDIVLLGCSGLLYFFSDVGDTICSIPLDGNVAPPIIAQSGNIYVGASSGKFYAIGAPGSSLLTQADTAIFIGPIDSRPPVVDAICPPDTIFYGDTIAFTWEIEEMFPNAAEQCSIIIYYCEGADTFLTDDTLTWTPPLVACDSAFIAIAVPDSFCNWGYDTCDFIAMAAGWMAVSFHDTTVMPCDTVEIILNIDSLLLPFTSEVQMNINVNGDIVEVLDFTPLIVPAPDTSSLSGSGNSWTLYMGWYERQILSGTEMGILTVVIDCDAMGGEFSVLDIDTITADLVDFYYNDGVAIVDYTPEPWLALIHFECKELSRSLSFGNHASASDDYDATYDLLYMPPPPGEVDVWFHMDDAEYPAITKLLRDMRDMEPVNTWIAVTNEEADIYVHWNGEHLDEGIYMLNGIQDMRADTYYYASPMETLTITWDLPEFSTGTMEFDAGWNLLSTPYHNPSGEPASIFPGSFAGPYGYDTMHDSYYLAHWIEPGDGYWLFYTGAGEIPAVGVPIERYGRAVSMGWNLIGTTINPISVDSITIEPPTEIIGMFGYEPTAGYFVPDTLFPGRGYWIMPIGNGILWVPAGE